MAVGRRGDHQLSEETTSVLCRDCPGLFIPLRQTVPTRCPVCGSRRLVAHPDLVHLAIAHVDCDAFFASVEKQRRPELTNLPLLVGGIGDRGVVSTACYIARLNGARSAMSMRRARELCPDAVILPPDMNAYRAVSARIRELMCELTPLVEVRSIDEATLDLSGTEQIHGAPPCVTVARLALIVERKLGVTISIGLAANPLMSKLAASIDKPRGFGVIGSEAREWLAEKPVRILPGIGKAQEQALHRQGFVHLAGLAALSNTEALRRLGPRGPSLAARARGEDDRAVTPLRPTKSVSAEKTFSTDISNPMILERELWELCEQLASRLRRKGFAATGISLKLRTAAFRTTSRATTFISPTVLPDRLFSAARDLLGDGIGKESFRLLGLGSNGLAPLAVADPPDLADAGSQTRVAMQHAIDTLRNRFGNDVIKRGRSVGTR
ncbi:DNA polymerase IV [Acetobacter fallax]|uniref:DNA polymerase IV n=1 Tax=Acetobacter fallax TaxID=1737473 RepID=A0ABX0K910_9PROT|nr:DNA polymerase IV [Acetobacter fallax]NHO32247.1 DNA polymerase IV [Acetobacter fallax]NHO35807.1 DNA polymerase IV [Acetobacter fallax]